MSRHDTGRALELHVGYWLRFVSNHVSHAFMQKLGAKGVTVAEWIVLQEVLQAGETRPSHLADRLGMTRGAISKLVERLSAKELVERRASENDRRSQCVSLTARGRRLVPILARLADANDREFFGHLSEGQAAALVNCLRDLVHRHGWKDVPVS